MTIYLEPLECRWYNNKPLSSQTFLTESGYPSAELANAELAKDGIVFSAVRIWQRQKNGKVVPKDKLSLHDILASKDDEIKQQWQNLIQPRKYCLGLLLKLSMPLVIGIVNVTPDSFSDGGRLYCDEQKASDFTFDLLQKGADIVDIGGESTRPGARTIELEEEKKRVIPVIKKIAKQKSVNISVDTRKAAVMQEALKAGATIINDVSALQYDSKSAEVVAKNDANVIIMHSSSIPEDMQSHTGYHHVVFDIYDFLKQRLQTALAAGIKKHKIAIDPGIGFGKNVRQNLQIIASLAIFHSLGVPIVLGTSRKSFIGKLTNEQEPAKRIAGSLATILYAAASANVQCVRVHDVQQTKQAFCMWKKLRQSSL